MTLSIIAAMSENGTIGRAGAMPWHLPDDLKNFKRLTRNHAVIMGRKTYVSVGKPLSDRVNIIVTRDRSFTDDRVIVTHSLTQAITVARDHKLETSEVFVIGGAEIYQQALPLADRMYLTIIHTQIDGDVRFPEFDQRDWVLETDEHHPADDRHVFAFSIRSFLRKHTTD